jgi:uncharacterized protein YndB with AHSA1/START domain
MTQSKTDRHEIDIAAAPDTVWKALVDPDLTEQYYFGTRVQSDWKPGSPILYPNPEGYVFVDGQIKEFNPPRRLVTTFQPRWDEQIAKSAPTVVSWEVAPKGDGALLVLIHEGAPDNPLVDMLHQSWRTTLEDLKKVVEAQK